MTRQERLDAVAAAHRAWEKRHEGSMTPDPKYAKNKPSQYAEGIVAVSATPEMEQEFDDLLRQASP